MADTRMTVRIPAEMAEFIKREAKENYTSQNAEIVRTIKDRMKAAQNEKAGSPLTA